MAECKARIVRRLSENANTPIANRVARRLDRCRAVQIAFDYAGVRVVYVGDLRAIDGSARGVRVDVAVVIWRLMSDGAGYRMGFTIERR